MATPPSDGKDDVIVRPFADFLREQSGGRTHEELSELLHELVSRVRDTGKKGTITVTISAAPMKGDTNILMLTDTVRSKLPEHDRKPSVFYPDADGNLVRNDPRQLAFESLREVGGTSKSSATDLQEKRA